MAARAFSGVSCRAIGARAAYRCARRARPELLRKVVIVAIDVLLDRGRALTCRVPFTLGYPASQ